MLNKLLDGFRGLLTNYEKIEKESDFKQDFINAKGQNQLFYFYICKVETLVNSAFRTRLLQYRETLHNTGHKYWNIVNERHYMTIIELIPSRPPINLGFWLDLYNLGLKKLISEGRDEYEKNTAFSLIGMGEEIFSAGI
jgi:hypothetical protein